jgi:drug/metabolite transporter (DMT)-like permease
MNDTSRTRPARGWRLWLALAVVYLVWGSTYLAIRVMVETIPPLLGAGVRFLLAGGTGLVTVAERDVPSGLAAVLVAYTAYVWMLANAPVSQATTHTHVNPVVAVLLGWLVLHERVTIATLAGAALVVGSVAAVVRHESGRSGPGGPARRGQDAARQGPETVP